MTIFKSWEEAEEEFYKHNNCLSDDSDSEGARVERWVEDCGHEIAEEMHTMEEWADIKPYEHKEKVMPDGSIVKYMSPVK